MAWKHRAQGRYLTVAARRALLLCVVLLSVSLNTFVAQTHVDATQRVAAAAHGHPSGPSFENDTRGDICVLCQIASHAAPLVFGSAPQLSLRPAETTVPVGYGYQSPPLILAHRGQARAPPPATI
ncbi:MAG: hypothetical protein JSR66_33640 [Proteobacteria bacterium]|nr:hypothetical protein [Pseudomonadota bacterium]